MSLEGKVALVTGGGRGIGRGLAIELAREGSDIVITSRTASELHETAETIRSLGRLCLDVAIDATDEQQVSELFDTVDADFGRLDILVNNAGGIAVAPLTETTVEQWDQVQAANVGAAFLCSRAAIPMMRSVGGGSIINISSMGGVAGFPMLAAYCSAKAAIIGFTRALAAELADDGIRVNALCPDIVATPTTLSVFSEADKSDWADPEDMGSIVVFLAGRDSKFVNGAVIEATGRWPHDPLQRQYLAAH